jgi:hypothetical protein
MLIESSGGRAHYELFTFDTERNAVSLAQLKQF